MPCRRIFDIIKLSCLKIRTQLRVGEMKKFIMYHGKQTEVASLLTKVTPFSSLDIDTVEALVSEITIREVPNGTYVFRQGDASLRTLFIIVSGAAETTILDDQHKEVVVALREEMDFFGETAFLSDDPYIASVKAIKDLTMIVLPFEVFDTILSGYAEFSTHFGKIMTGRMRALYHGQMTGASSGYATDQPMHKRVADLMSAPAVTCHPGDDVTVVAQTMATKNVSSILVVNEEKQPMGIITEKDLVRKVVADGCFVKSLKAEDIVSGNLHTVSPDAFYYEALLLMVGKGVKHLAVTAEDELIGMITIRDMIISRGTTALSISKNIEQQNTIDALAVTSQEIDKALEGLVAENANSKEILQLITELFDRLTRKVIQVCEQQMIDEGHGSPPVPYSWITMGSSGRQEQFVKTDQDNGIIYENVEPGSKEVVDQYFLRLGEKVVDGLHRCGFALCPGNVMASNPKWCRSSRDWAKSINHWFNKMDPENVRLMTIFLDFRHVYGEKTLCERIRKYVMKGFSDSPSVMHFLAQDDLNHRVPLNFFKQIITEKSGENRGTVNLKGSACVHLVDAMRILSYREGIVATNTLQRLNELSRRSVFSQDDLESITMSYETLMVLRIQQSLKQLRSGKQPDNYIDPDELSKREKAALRDAFITVDRVQTLISHAFKAYN